MTVKQLIKKLQALPPDSVCWVDDGNGLAPISAVWHNKDCEPEVPAYSVIDSYVVGKKKLSIKFTRPHSAWGKEQKGKQ